MNMLIRVVISRLLLTVILGAPISAAAQTAPLQVGEKVRIRWTFESSYTYGLSTMRSAVAHVVDYDAGHVMLRRGHRMFTVPTRSITTLERRIGTKPASAPAIVIASGVGGIYEDVCLENLAPDLVMRPSARVGLSLTIGGR